MSPKNLLGKIKRAIYRLRILFQQYKQSGFANQFLDELIGGRSLLYNPEVIVPWKLGSENRNKIVCIVRFPRVWVPTAGFFALFNRMLCGLYYANSMGFVPVVDDWGGCPYEESEPVNGSNVVFEYYFKPVSDISLKSAVNSQHVCFTSNPNLSVAEKEFHSEWFNPSKEFIRQLGYIFRKYIQLNDIVRVEIERDISKMLGRSTLGIHFRGTDYKLNENGHPVSVQLEQYFPIIDYAIKKYHFSDIFLATDDKIALQQMKKRYKNVRYYKDVSRSEGTASVHFLPSQDHLHRYRMGYEVLRDAYTLAACDGLIGGNSQVVIGARINKASTGKNYQFMQIISNGINCNNFDGMEYYRKHLMREKEK